MLRISYSLKQAVQQWTICGQLAGPWVQELRSCWEHAAKDVRSVLDLTDVTFIDEGGERLLLDMRGEGVEFVATGVETKDLIENLRTHGEKTLRRLVARGKNCEQSI